MSAKGLGGQRGNAIGRAQAAPDLLKIDEIAAEIADALVAPLTRMLATLAAEQERRSTGDPWLSQCQSPLPSRVHWRLMRQLEARGDARARRHGKLAFVRASAIDEYMCGNTSRSAVEPTQTFREQLRAQLRDEGLLR